MNEHEPNLAPVPVGESELAKVTGDHPKKRYKYTVDEFGDRWTDVPDLAELKALYRQTYGEDLPTWARTRRVGGDPYPSTPVSERIVSIRAAEHGALAAEALRQSDPLTHAAKSYGVDPSRIEWTDYRGQVVQNPEELRKAGRIVIARVKQSDATPGSQPSAAVQEPAPSSRPESLSDCERQQFGLGPAENHVS